MDCYKELHAIIVKVREWAKEFNSGNEDYSFDVDNLLHDFSNKYNVNLKEEPFVQIYNLLDFYCDAIKHRFKSISPDYYMGEATQDISGIINNLEANNFERLTLNKSFIIKLNALFL